MNRISELIKDFELPEGFSESKIPGIRFFKSSKHIPRHPIFYDPSICIIAQGNKTGTINGKTFEYDSSHYLVTSVSIPFECETFATPEEPLYAIYIDIDLKELHEIISLIDATEKYKEKESCKLLGVGPAIQSHQMIDATARLLDALKSSSRARILGPGIIREIYYYALNGCQSSALYALGAYNGNFARIANVLQKIHDDYTNSLDVENLAGQALMSSSAFHRAFKEVTGDSPIQYLKKVRLNKAKDLMIAKGLKAYMAADEVGYESASQFSREFKRYFGKTPNQIVKDIKAA